MDEIDRVSFFLQSLFLTIILDVIREDVTNVILMLHMQMIERLLSFERKTNMREVLLFFHIDFDPFR